MAKSNTNPALKKYLILTSSGGGGHIAAARAKREELINKGIPEHQIEVIDLMGLDGSIATNKGKPWIPTLVNPMTGEAYFSGEANTEKWDELQKKGGIESVKALEKLVGLQWIAESIQAGTVYDKMKEYLEEYDVQEIYDTQALSTPSICQAIKEKNDQAKLTYGERGVKKLHVTKIVTEFLTHRAVHFLEPLSRIKAEHRDVLEVQVVKPPLLGPSEELDDFKQKHGVSNIKLTFLNEQGIEPPVRQEFKTVDYTKPPSILIKGLSATEIQQKNDKKRNEIANKHKNLERGDRDKQIEQEYKKVEMLNESEVLNNQLKGIATIEGNDFKINKEKGDKLITITLGSQGSSTVLSYVDSFIEQALKSTKSEGAVYLCLAVGKNEGQDSLYAKTLRHINDRTEQLRAQGIAIPENFKILPLAFQDGKHMASLLQNSDVLVTRTGGMSSVEAEYTQQKNKNRKVYLHSEEVINSPHAFPRHNYDAVYEGLISGTVKWEGGNAEYLMKNIGASLGSPQTIDFNIAGSKEGLSSARSLFHLAYNNELTTKNNDLIQELIYEGSNPNLRFPDNSRLIDHARDLETKVLLVNNGARITSKALEGLSEMEQKKLHTLRSRFKEDNKSRRDLAHAEFVKAIQKGDLKKVTGLLYNFKQLKNELINIEGDDYISLAQFAIKFKNTSALKLLVEGNIKINEVNDFGTALHYAVENNNLEAVKILISLGANPHIQHHGKTAYDLLEGKNSDHLPILDFFIRENILNPVVDRIPNVIGKKAENLNKLMYEEDNKYNNTPLHIAAFLQLDIKEMERILSENLKKINSVNANGQTPLSLCNNQEIRRLMVRCGADVSYLPSNLNLAEVQELTEISLQHKMLLKDTKSLIINEFKQSKGDAEQFANALANKFERFYEAEGGKLTEESKKVIKERCKKTHEDLIKAREEEKKLNSIDKIINLFAKIAGASKFDKALKSISKETKKELKHENRAISGLDPTLIAKAKDIGHKLKTTEKVQQENVRRTVSQLISPNSRGAS